MRWTCLVATEESASLSHHGSNPSFSVKSSDILDQSCYPVCQTVGSPEHRSGMTFERSTANLGTEKSISSAEDFHARTFLLQELAWKESEAVFFFRSCGWPRKSSPHSFSSKMSKQSGYAVWTELSGNFPGEGMTVDGKYYPLKKSAPSHASDL